MTLSHTGVVVIGMSGMLGMLMDEDDTAIVALPPMSG